MTSREPTTQTPGWYPDARRSDLVRWWDGRDWTEHTAAAGPALTVVPSSRSAPTTWPRVPLPAGTAATGPAPSAGRRRTGVVWIWAAAIATATVAIAVVLLILALAG